MYDHRKLGRELELFDTDPLIGAGLPYWLPAGAAIRHALEEYIREVERRAGYQHADALAEQAVGEGLRAVVARPESGSLGARIRAHRLAPYQAVVGAREAAAGQVALRLRDGRRVSARPAGEVLARIRERVAARDTQLWEEAATAV